MREGFPHSASPEGVKIEVGAERESGRMRYELRDAKGDIAAHVDLEMALPDDMPTDFGYQGEIRQCVLSSPDGEVQIDLLALTGVTGVRIRILPDNWRTKPESMQWNVWEQFLQPRYTHGRNGAPSIVTTEKPHDFFGIGVMLHELGHAARYNAEGSVYPAFERRSSPLSEAAEWDSVPFDSVRQEYGIIDQFITYYPRIPELIKQHRQLDAVYQKALEMRERFLQLKTTNEMLQRAWSQAYNELSYIQKSDRWQAAEDVVLTKIDAVKYEEYQGECAQFAAQCAQFLLQTKLERSVTSLVLQDERDASTQAMQWLLELRERGIDLTVAYQPTQAQKTEFYNRAAPGRPRMMGLHKAAQRDVGVTIMETYFANLETYCASTPQIRKQNVRAA